MNIKVSYKMYVEWLIAYIWNMYLHYIQIKKLYLQFVVIVILTLCICTQWKLYNSLCPAHTTGYALVGGMQD